MWLNCCLCRNGRPQRVGPRSSGFLSEYMPSSFSSDRTAYPLSATARFYVLTTLPYNGCLNSSVLSSQLSIIHHTFEYTESAARTAISSLVEFCLPRVHGAPSRDLVQHTQKSLLLPLLVHGPVPQRFAISACSGPIHKRNDLASTTPLCESRLYKGFNACHFAPIRCVRPPYPGTAQRSRAQRRK